MPGGRRKKDKRRKKGKRGNNSGSSTPQSSTPSVEDEKQQLLQGGACGSSESHESRSAEKTKQGSGRTETGKQSPYRSPGASSSRNTPQSGHSPKKDLLAVPDQESVACAPISPSKRSPLALLKNVFSPKKKSPNRSSDPECSCKDKKNHQPECPELKTPAVGARDKSTRISANESKPPSSNASPIISKKNLEGTQSSSSSDPSVAEYFRNATESKEPTERSLLVPDQENADASSPSKKSPLKRLKNVFQKRRSPNRSSDTECSCDDKTDHELECPERRRDADAKSKPRKGKSPNRSQIKSGASSSSVSPVSGKYKSSASSRRSNSKSSSNSGSNVECSCPDKENHAFECLLRNKSSTKSKSNTRASSISTDYDPLEGPSSGPARREHNRERSRADEILNRSWRRYAEEIGGPLGEGMVPIIEDIEDDPEEERRDTNRPVPRRRTRSFRSYVIRIFRSVTARRSSPQRYNLRNFNIRLRRMDWHWFEYIKWRASNVEAAAQRNPAMDIPDENERGLLRRIETGGRAPSVRRHQSLSPVPLRRCTCGGGRVNREGRLIDRSSHFVGCARINDVRRRIRRRKNRHEKL